MPLGTAMVMYTLVGGASAALLLALLGLSLLFATRFRKRGETREDATQYHPACFTVRPNSDLCRGHNDT